MDSMVFQVSAKTARLIGRENISDVDGAVLELVKNGYDADADCVFVKYIIPFVSIPKKLSLSEVNTYFADKEDLIKKSYKIKDGEYHLDDKIGEYGELRDAIMNLCTIIILDNGSGMSLNTLQSSWMNIGTDDKEKNIYSKVKHRIKTGAKGIGRFALDKLSLKTSVYTKASNEKAYKWEIDWGQFDKSELLNQVTADLSEIDLSFSEIISPYIEENLDVLQQYDWSTGTLIVLNPIRSFWNQKQFIKVNNNLKNINPLGSVDQFDVIVRNKFFEKYNYSAVNKSIDRNCYDYKIEASYNGEDNITIVLDRNEINNHDIAVTHTFSKTDVENYDINEFWGLEAFNKPCYSRDSFDGEIRFEYKLSEILPANEDIDLELYKSVGKFSLTFYYLKNTKSTLEIVKGIQPRKRKKILDLFSGIKIYRDSFKVRPYGDEGHFYDWLTLGERVQASPAAASHPTGKWRVSPNQLIGSVSISRINNPLLQDSANREGMTLNSQYDAFVNLIDGIISKFEYDRQYVLREYAQWIGDKVKSHINRAQEIYEQYKKEQNGLLSMDDKLEQEDIASDEIKTFTKEELKEAILTLGDEREKQVSTQQLIQVLSSSGVLAQTFSHEITRMETEFGSRGQQLRASIDELLDHKPYIGDEDFNPYIQIQELDETDLLLFEWVGLIMNSISSDRFDRKNISICTAVADICELWKPLLMRKHINLSMDFEADIELKVQLIDLHLLLNNFILNSSYFLEEAEGERNILINVYSDEKRIILDMRNNGPTLDSKYMKMPDETLDARETTKKDGTGLGLWIAKEAVMRSDGELHVIPVDDGYLLRATWANN